MSRRTRTLLLDEESLRAYSRRGNFHSDPETARALGFTGLVAQGAQVCGPAYGLLLDEWGEDFLARGRIDLRFVSMVVAGEEVEAAVEFDAGGEAAGIEVRNCASDRVSVVGTARLPQPAEREGK